MTTWVRVTPRAAEVEPPGLAQSLRYAATNTYLALASPA